MNNSMPIDHQRLMLRLSGYHARIFATAAHEAVGQVRKYSGVPYFTHPEAVVEILLAHVPLDQLTPEMISAAYLHDVAEDTKVTLDRIEAQFGPEVARLVGSLTKLDRPDLNRAQRKELECMRLKWADNKVKTIKLADRLHNVSDIIVEDPTFARTFVPETADLLQALIGGDVGLWKQLDAIVCKWYEENACVKA